MPADQASVQDLRQRAEAISVKNISRLQSQLAGMTPSDLQQALHDLSVHQLELEMQNEELRRTQVALDASRDQYFDLYDLAPVSYCTVNAAGLMVQANLTTATLLGLPRGLLVNRLFVRHILTADHGIYFSLKKDIAAQSGPHTCELRMVRHNGDVFWAQITASAAEAAEGPPVSRLVLLDITERKRSEEVARMNQHLAKSEAFSRDIIDSVPAGIAVLDRNGVIVAVNQAWRLFAKANSANLQSSLSQGDVGTNYLVACTFSACPNPADSVAVCNGIQNVLDGLAPTFALDYQCTASTQVRWFNMTATPLWLSRAGVVIAHTEITQRKLNEEALRESEEKYRLLTENSDEVIWTLDPESFRFRYVSPAVFKLRGYTPEEIMAEPMDTALTPEGSQMVRGLIAQRMADLRAGKTSIDTFFEAEVEQPRKDGTTVWTSVVTNYYLQPKTNRYEIRGVTRDITQRKKADAELRIARAEAEQANNAKSRFLAAASHDLRQPMSALSLYVGVLKNRATPENTSLINRIQDCSDSLSELLTDLLDVSKLDAGVVQPRLSDFAIDTFLNGIGSVFSGEASNKGLRLHVRGGAGIITRTDAHLLGRVVRNLVANAIRYTHAGGVLVACRPHGGTHWIEVWDTGIGIPEDKTSLIFEEFTQLGDALPSRGSGLGLAIVAKASALLGLAVRVQSRPGRGSVFAIQVPAWTALQPVVNVSAQALPGAQRLLRVGLVEDNAELRQAMVLALESLGHTVIAVWK